MSLSKEELDVYVTLVAAAVTAGEVSDDKISELVQCVNAYRKGQNMLRIARATAEGYRCTPDSRVVLQGLSLASLNGERAVLKSIIDGKADVVLDEPIIRGTGDKKRTVSRFKVPVQCVKRCKSEV